MAWHLAEIDGYVGHGVTVGKFDFNEKLPGLERPRAIEALAPGYEKVHADALARVRALKEEDLKRTIPFFDGTPMSIGSILWNVLLHHMIHHRGQLSLMCRLAGGKSPGIYGPNREDMAAMMERMKGQPGSRG